MSENLRMVQESAAIPAGLRSNVDRIGPQNDLIVSQLHGGMTEQTLRDNVFGGASQAATTTTVALATTYTGLCLSNPAGNSKNLILRQVGFGLSVAPGATGFFGLGVGFSTAGITVHTTPLVGYNQNVGSNNAPTAKIDGAATLVAGAGQGLRRVSHILGSYDDDAAIKPQGPSLIDIDGGVVIQPGGFAFVYTLTVVVGALSFSWEEVPRA